MDSTGSGSSFTIASGITYIIDNISTLLGGSPLIKKLIANLSLGGSASSTIDNAVQQLIDNNIAVSVAAGNSDNDSCFFSPSRLASVLTVGASDSNDFRAVFSNYGSCVDLSAPGVNIVSTYIGSNTAIHQLSGTSMSSPHVAGVIGLTWQADKSLTNVQVQNTVKEWATPDIVSGASVTGGGKDLLYSLINPLVPAPEISPPPTLPANGSSLFIMILSNTILILFVYIL